MGSLGRVLERPGVVLRPLGAVSVGLGRVWGRQRGPKLDHEGHKSAPQGGARGGPGRPRRASMVVAVTCNDNVLFIIIL